MAKIEIYREAVCPVCGKKFIPAPMHRYRLDDQYKYVCSWSCLCESRRQRTRCSPQGRAKTVVKIDEDGNEIARYNSIVEAAEAHGVKPPTMSTYIWKKQIFEDGTHYEILERN